jgi:hypothetical protein
MYLHDDLRSIVRDSGPQNDTNPLSIFPHSNQASSSDVSRMPAKPATDLNIMF